MLLKLLPITALAAVGYVGTGAVQKGLEMIGKVEVAATSNIEMQGIADAVSAEYVESETLPIENFSAFLVENLRQAKGNARDKSKDPWGTPYRLKPADKGFQIESAGPDKKWATTDDLKLYRSLEGIGVQLPSGPLPTRSPPPTLAQRQAAPKPTKGPLQSPEAARQQMSRDAAQRQLTRAAQGSASAQYEIGLRYMNGDGLDKNLELARKWLNVAANNGHESAVKVLERLASKKSP